MKINLFEARLPAGFPSQAEDYIEQQLDLNEFIVPNPAATFFVKVEGDSMKGAGIQSGSMLVVDRSLTPKSGDVVVALLQGEFTVKKLEIGEKRLLVAANSKYPSIEIKEGSDFQVWGVVSFVITSL